MKTNSLVSLLQLLETRRWRRFFFQGTIWRWVCSLSRYLVLSQFKKSLGCAVSCNRNWRKASILRSTTTLPAKVPGMNVMCTWANTCFMWCTEKLEKGRNKILLLLLFLHTHPQEVLLDLLLRLTATKQQFPFLIQHFTQEEKPNSSSSSLPSISYKSQLQQQQQQMSLSFSPAKACWEPGTEVRGICLDSVPLLLLACYEESLSWLESFRGWRYNEREAPY